MSDQDTKPTKGVEDVKGVEAPAEKSDTIAAKSEVAPEAIIDQSSNVAVKDEDESKDGIKAPQDTSVVKEEVKEETKEEAKEEASVKEEATEVAKVEQEDKTEANKAESATPTDGRSGVKPMLRVKRGDPQEKSNPSLLSDSDDHTLIRRQVHFYFSDSNLPNDTFLWKNTDGTNNKAVPLSLISSFSRMRRFKPYTAVVDALKSSDQVVLEGPEGEETVRRKEPYQQSDEKDKAILERTVYIKGFGPEHKRLQFDIEDFVAQFGEFNAVRLRRDEMDEKKNFKGSVFVEWIDKETADKFMALEPRPAWKLGEELHKLDFQWKVDYDKAKEEEEALRGNKRRHHPGQRGQRGGKAGRGGRDSNDWKKRHGGQRNGSNHRGGRGGGRGRGRGQDSHGRTSQTQSSPQSNGRPVIHISEESAKTLAKKNSEATTNGKRPRDTADAADAPPSKKVDTKTAAVEAA
ncbi:hypothetical protein GGR52DRAFT_539704 [Hypoxylon sp. FL1284]|nr:hypothetical protein GGR52DRAFT_539704 [Hypoxylon sp. FL1284]